MHFNPIFGVFGISGGELIILLAGMIIFAVIVGTVIVLVFGLLSERKRTAAAPSPVPPVIPQATKRVCPQCATELAADAPQGLCPKCLLKAAFESQAVPAGQGPREPSPALPVDEIRKAFPLLEIIELLGQGGMGMVYKARQAQLDRLVALKILSPSLSNDPAFAERFLREAKALAHLNHPNIVSVYDFGKAGEFYFLTMEFVDGMNLWQLEQSKKRLTPEEALSIIPKICDALQYAHDEGIVHRDIKPANILVDKKGRVKIADFGLAKLLGTEPKGLGLTQTKMTMGTPQYMAPEQLEKPLEVDHRADIFSLGVVFYEMLTGELPLGRFAPPSRKVQIDVRLDEVVMRALEKEPELRYQQASQVKTDVETITNDPQRTVPLAVPPVVKAGTTAPPKICPNVVIGAVWAAFFFLAATVIWTFKYHAYGAPRFFYSLISIPFFLLGGTAPFGTTVIGWTSIGKIRRAKGQLTGLGLAIFDALLFPWLILTGAMVFLWYVILMMLRISPLMPSWLKGEEGTMCIWIIGLFGIAVMMVAILVWIIRWILRANRVSDAGNPPHPNESPRRAIWPWVLAVFGTVILAVVVTAVVAKRFYRTTAGPVTVTDANEETSVMPTNQPIPPEAEALLDSMKVLLESSVTNKTDPAAQSKAQKEYNAKDVEMQRLLTNTIAQPAMDELIRLAREIRDMDKAHNTEKMKALVAQFKTTSMELEKLVRQRPAVSAQNSFGPTTVILLRSVNVDWGTGLNLDNGDEIPLSDAERTAPSQDLLVPLEKRGASFALLNNGKSWEILSSAKLARVEGWLWKTGSPVIALAAIDSINARLESTTIQSGFQSYNLSFETDGTQTLWFQTKKGKTGLLQLSTGTGNVKGLELSYKWAE